MTTYDPDILSIIDTIYDEGHPNSRPKVFDIPDPEPVVVKKKKRKVKLLKGTQWFSDIFWEPTTVPDFPVPVFKDSDWDTTVQHFIPKGTKPADIFYHWPQREAELLVSSVLRGGNRCLLHGSTGTGKTTLPEMVCAVLRIPFVKISCFEEMKVSHYIGKDTVIVNPTNGMQEVAYEASNLVLCCKHGGMAVLDEFNRPGPATNMSIQPLLERGGYLTLQDAAGLSSEERIISTPEGKFWLIATDNTNGLGDTSGNYSASVQDLSTLDRLTSSIKVGYLPQSAEIGIISRAHPDMDESLATLMVQVGGYIRDAFEDGKLMQTMSPRALLSWANHVDMYDNTELAFIVAYYDKLGDDCRAVVREIYHQVMSVNLPN